MAPVAQCIERRASNAEVVGEIPARSTIPKFRRSPMQRQRAQTSSSAGASPAAGTNFKSTNFQKLGSLISIGPRGPIKINRRKTAKGGYGPHARASSQD